VLLYWGGTGTVSISSAANACSATDLYWANRQGTWLGFAKAAPTASDTWDVSTGEAHFVHGRQLQAAYKDISYDIEGRVITLTNGVSEIEAAPGSAARIITRYFGNESTGDVNNDGTPDVGFLLTQSRGGSGTFYYVVVALKTQDGYVGTNAVLLGDRIAPQSTEIRNGSLIVNYADRRPGEPFTTPPSVGISKVLKVVDGKLSTVPN
jgi:hypothetical protein